MKYYFTYTGADESTVTSAKQGDKVYFEKPDSWGESLSAYVYGAESGAENASWPGISMTKISDNKYEYILESDFSDGLIIFTDGQNQYPGQNLSGLPIEADKTYAVE